MQKQSIRTNMVLAMGLLGILGAVLTLLSDIVLLGKPGSGSDFFKIGTETMAGIAQWRITFGTFAGIVVLPFQIAGLVTVYYGLRPAGKAFSLVVVLPIVHALTMGVAFHSSYAFIASGWKLSYEMGKGNELASEMINKFDYYWKIIGFIILAELLFSSICYVFMILKRQTLYPKWMSILSPFGVLLILYPIVFAIPAPVGGFVAPTYVNLSTIVFLCFSTIVVYKRLK